MIRLTSIPFASIATAACTASLLMVAPLARAQTPAAAETGRLHAADQTFIASGTQAVATQRDAARIASARSSDRDVKAFAERVSSDDAKITAALRAASPRGVDVPKDDPDMSVLASINTLRGAEFDNAYIEQVALADEQKTLSVFQAEIASGRDAQLKDAATKALPTIQQHYAMARDLAKRKHLAGRAQ
ncbi:DUF4142 domain-containing protein [Paraburkholderia sp. ZP32-5]|uniref:DUF4142 domain-containing protein n=1 Tax=Paraburkholderia sp. ZP32-5 TaxID=2883245 RepID=UPI001F25100C|nr:DUF4142 domain-containing protein [Paraburkholderia sp. ZP32-5]